MKVVLDNNVLVSAVITPVGTSGAIFAAWRSAGFQLIVSPALLSELLRVLAYPRIVKRTGWALPEQEAFVELLREASLQVSPREQPAVSRDPADDAVLAAAAAGSADYIVSGDNDLLVLGGFEGIPIVSPARFLTTLREPDLKGWTHLGTIDRSGGSVPPWPAATVGTAG
ncbi:MAG: putative toxin-antitoxin system toxin component, PIN family [Tepidiformaceae bacterium]